MRAVASGYADLLHVLSLQPCWALSFLYAGGLC